MTRHRIAMLALAVAVIAAGCSGGTEAEPPPTKPAATSTSTPTEPAAPPAVNPLETAPAAKMLGLDLGDIVRAEDGTHLVVTSSYKYADRSVYRLYDRRWAPLTPMLGVRGELSIDRGLRHSFLGSLFAYRDKGLPRVNERVLIAGDGTLRRSTAGSADDTSRGPQSRRLAARVRGVRAHGLSTRRPDRLPGHERRSGTPLDSSLTNRRPATSAPWRVTAQRAAPSHTSVDEGRTFTDLSAAVLPGQLRTSAAVVPDRRRPGRGHDRRRIPTVAPRARPSQRCPRCQPLRRRPERPVQPLRLAAPPGRKSSSSTPTDPACTSPPTPATRPSSTPPGHGPVPDRRR